MQEIDIILGHQKAVLNLSVMHQAAELKQLSLMLIAPL
jgi:hypothetical protein